MPKKMLYGLIVLIAVAATIIGLIALKPEQNTVINGIGAKVTFENPEIVRILDEKYGITVNILTNSGLDKFEQNGKVDYNGVDVIFGGSASFADELKVKYPDGLPNSAGNPLRILEVKTVAQSPLLIHVKTANGDLDAFLRAGIFTQNGNSYSISGDKLLSIINCSNANGDWNSIGVNIPGKCRFGFTNPNQSSGGRYTLSFIGSCQTNPEDPCSQTITVEQLPSVMESLMHAFDVSGKKPGDNDSVQFYYDWANSQSAAERLMFAYESAPISWLASPNVPASFHDQASKSIALVYPEYTFMSTQVGVSLSDPGKRLVEIMTTDPDIIAALNGEIGFRAGFGGNLPQVLPSINPNPSFTIIPDPRADVTKAITTEICTRWPENPGCTK